MDSKKLFLTFAIFLLVVGDFGGVVVLGSAQSGGEVDTGRDFTGNSQGATYSNSQLAPNYDVSYSGSGELTGGVYSSRDLSTYWPILNQDPEQCEFRQDLILQVAPAGCEPTVVRSDLLADQNVPVFCQVDAYQINPLIDISRVRNIRFSGEYPDEVVGVGFHPARAALRGGPIGYGSTGLGYNRLFGSQFVSNIGYVVVVLRQQPVESELPDFVNLTLHADISYDSSNVLGVGKAEYALTSYNDREWAELGDGEKDSFWQGRYFVRLESADAERARISLYRGDVRLTTTEVVKGQASPEIYIPGGYCQAGLKIHYDGFVSSRESARIEIVDDRGTDSFDVFRGSRFLDNRCRVTDIDVDDDGQTGKVEVSCTGEGTFELELKRRPDGSTGDDSAVLMNANLVPVESDGYYESAIENYEEVADDFTGERKAAHLGGERYGELALLEGVALSEYFTDRGVKKELDADRLLGKFESLYPNSTALNGVTSRRSQLSEVDSSLAAFSPYTGNKFTTVRLLQFNNPAQKSKADFVVGGQTIELEEAKSYSFDFGNDGKGRITLDELEDERATVTSRCEGDDKSDRNTFSVGQERNLCGATVRFRDADLRSVAKVRLEPLARGTGSEANFSVHVGIEKRAIELSPDKTADRIEELNKTIEKWEDASDKLGNVVSGMKAACFATSALLTFKNFFSGLSGEALARQKVMRGNNGWTQICEDAAARGEYSGSVDQCFIQNAAEINSDVQATTQAIESVNQKIQSIQNKYPSSQNTILGQGAVQTDKVKEDVGAALKSEFGGEAIEMVNNRKWINGGDSTTVAEVVDSGEMSLEEMREVWLNLERRKASGFSQGQSDNINYLLGESAGRVSDSYRLSSDLDKSKAFENLGFSKASVPQSQLGKQTAVDIVDSSLHSNYVGFENSEIKHSTTFTGLAPANTDRRDGQNYNFEGGTYVAGLGKSSTGDIYSIQEIVKIDESGRPVKSITDPKELAAFTQTYGLTGSFVPTDDLDYNNRMREGDRKVRYYETEPYKGMPAIVPFDPDNGWYAATQQDLPTFGGIGAFDSSGRVASFYLCNVGRDGEIDFNNGYDDDICQRIDRDTGQSVGTFPNLDRQRADSLVRTASRAISDAASQYAEGSGPRTIRVAGQNLEIGNPSIGRPGTQCQDFMSPEDCHFMFNICDPVICPSSRCDLGGEYPVEDVVQTGIVGSVLLCLPNIREGIFIPVCLTGIKAGIDGLISIMRAHRDCLQENLETGQLVGICDEIYSVYLCEFFWRQVAPAVNVLIPRLLASAYGQGVRGGGEYLTVQTAWQNAQNSVDYFTQSYAVNSIRAFQFRNIEEAGGEFCKTFISTAAPKTFKALIEPDSPVQFHAWFDSIKFTSATVPATAQYKVFYHIFAGNDIGSYYQVYLKRGEGYSEDPRFGTGFGDYGSVNNPLRSGATSSGLTSSYSSSSNAGGFFNQNSRVVVASGFVPRGETVTETKDFTAPEGYRELCVLVNGDETCGFRQVSTSFALNALRDSYIEEELQNTNIQSEQACLSGTSNPLALANPNIQQGVEETLQPQIYEQGITRICATDNPGLGTDESRYRDVGNCGNQNLRCWLDTRSVSRAISENNVGARERTLEELEQNVTEQLLQGGDFLAPDVTNQELINLRNEFNGLGVNDVDEAKELLVKLNQLEDEVFLNNHKAQIVFLRGDVFGMLAKATAQLPKRIQQGSEDVDIDDLIDDPLDVGNYLYIYGVRTRYTLSGNEVLLDNDVVALINSTGGINVLQVLADYDEINGEIGGKIADGFVEAEDSGNGEVSVEGLRLLSADDEGREYFSVISGRSQVFITGESNVYVLSKDNFLKRVGTVSDSGAINTNTEGTYLEGSERGTFTSLLDSALGRREISKLDYAILEELSSGEYNYNVLKEGGVVSSEGVDCSEGLCLVGSSNVLSIDRNVDGGYTVDVSLGRVLKDGRYVGNVDSSTGVITSIVSPSTGGEEDVQIAFEIDGKKIKNWDVDDGNRDEKGNSDSQEEIVFTLGPVQESGGGLPFSQVIRNGVPTTIRLVEEGSGVSGDVEIQTIAGNYRDVGEYSAGGTIGLIGINDLEVIDDDDNINIFNEAWKVRQSEYDILLELRGVRYSDLVSDEEGAGEDDSGDDEQQPEEEQVICNNNGLLDAGEECDGIQFRGLVSNSCSQYGSQYSSGDLVCIGCQILTDECVLVGGDSGEDGDSGEEQQIDGLSCGSCGEGLFNICDLDECMALGNECEFVDGVVNSCVVSSGEDGEDEDPSEEEVSYKENYFLVDDTISGLEVAKIYKGGIFPLWTNMYIIKRDRQIRLSAGGAGASDDLPIGSIENNGNINFNSLSDVHLRVEPNINVYVQELLQYADKISDLKTLPEP